MEFSGIFYNYIVNKGKVRVKKFAEIYNYIVNDVFIEGYNASSINDIVKDVIGKIPDVFKK